MALNVERELERRARALRRLDAARHARDISPAYRRRLDAMRAAMLSTWSRPSCA